MTNIAEFGLMAFIFFFLLIQPASVYAVKKDTTGETNADWIQPDDAYSPAIWGIRGGIVISLWPYEVETGWPESRIRPRGLIRIGYEQDDLVYLINFVAVEPVVNGEMEFSEISPSVVDGEWGKLMWGGDTDEPGRFSPHAITRGIITHPDPDNRSVEQLSFYIFMEPFENGAHPYLRVTIRSDRPEEIGFEIFDHEGSAKMDRCALTATMGNYTRARLLYLKDLIVDSRELYENFDDIHFVERSSYPAHELMRDSNGDFITLLATNESFNELAGWPQSSEYSQRWTWRYRPYFKVTQYWRKEANSYDSSLRVRVNGRAKYWSAASLDPDDYVDIPGGVSFENFEMREDYYPGQKFFFGITRKTPDEMGLPLPVSSENNRNK